jgi:hypothetical protein
MVTNLWKMVGANNSSIYSEVLSLASNRLVGSISGILNPLGAKLTELSLSNNHLSGTIGESLCHLVNLGESSI